MTIIKIDKKDTLQFNSVEDILALASDFNKPQMVIDELKTIAGKIAAELAVKPDDLISRNIKGSMECPESLKPIVFKVKETDRYIVWNCGLFKVVEENFNKGICLWFANKDDAAEYYKLVKEWAKAQHIEY